MRSDSIMKNDTVTANGSAIQGFREFSAGLLRFVCFYAVFLRPKGSVPSSRSMTSSPHIF